MAVPEHLRTESKVEFLSNFHKFRKELYMLMARDFGLKQRSYDVELLKDIYKISDEDKTKLDEISTKYGMKSYIVKKIPDRSTFRRERRRLRKLKQKFANEEISKHKLDTIYNSWRGAIFKRFGNTRSLKNIDRIYENITKGEIKNERTG